jgi:hypothetical protein
MTGPRVDIKRKIQSHDVHVRHHREQTKAQVRPPKSTADESTAKTVARFQRRRKHTIRLFTIPHSVFPMYTLSHWRIPTHLGLAYESVWSNTRDELRFAVSDAVWEAYCA